MTRRKKSRSAFFIHSLRKWCVRGTGLGLLDPQFSEHHRLSPLALVSLSLVRPMACVILIFCSPFLNLSSHFALPYDFPLEVVNVIHWDGWFLLMANICKQRKERQQEKTRTKEYLGRLDTTYRRTNQYQVAQFSVLIGFCRNSCFPAGTVYRRKERGRLCDKDNRLL